VFVEIMKEVFKAESHISDISKMLTEVSKGNTSSKYNDIKAIK